MKANASRRAAAAGTLAAIACTCSPASADPTTPGLDAGQLHASAVSALTHLRTNLQTINPTSAAALTGAYVAFDPSTTDVTALAGCDDDGDPVVVVTEAMLRLLADVADTAVADVQAIAPTAAAANASPSSGPYAPLPRLDAYAELYAAQAANGSSRPVSPPAGTFASGLRTNAQSSHLYDAIVEAVVAHELAHLARGDVRCSNPTETHEAADDVWTAAEASAARTVATATYRAEKAVDADASAAQWMATLHDPKDGATVLLRFFAAVERRNTHAASYLATHPHAALRLEVFRAAWDRAVRPASAPEPTPAPTKAATHAHRPTG